MHVTGKILAGFVIVAFLVSFYMTTKTLAVRDAWMKLAQDNEATIKKNDQDIALKTRTLQEKRADYARTMIGWDREWVSAGAVVDQGGRLGLQIGTSQGIQPGQVLYVFAPVDDATSVYLGDFKVEQANEQQTRALPNSRRRAADLKEGQFQNVRVRTMIPNQYVKRLGDLDQSLLTAELSIQSQQEELARQARLAEQAEKLIASRLAELNGKPELANVRVPDVHIRGLLSSIVAEEEMRNAALIEADRLSRELKRTRDEFNTVRQENLKRVEGLQNTTATQAASR
ncbi:MAG: hypothetical protein JSS02_03560 [Planctomycetes bacterium]|nr:hypothetical protein [Planctomycetota bacterium]